MDNVVDVRPDRFLRAMRDTGSWPDAAKASGLSAQDVEQICRDNSKYDLAVIEAHMEWLEDRIMTQARDHLKQAREIHMEGYKKRHPEAD